jgi:hypothetical protein
MISRRHLCPPPILPPEVHGLKFSEMPEPYRTQIAEWVARREAQHLTMQRHARAFLIITAAVFFAYGAAIIAILFR